MKKLLLFLLFPLFAFSADIPLTPYIYKESGQFINITNFWVGNSNAINAVVTHPASGVTTNYPVNISGSSIDWTYPIQSKSCSGATTFTFSNTPSDTNYHTIDITLTNETGTATVEFPATVVWVPRVAFTLDQYAGAINTVRLMYVGGTVFGDYSQVITAVTASPPLSVSVGATNLAFSISVGTTSGTVAAGDDSRLSDARTPTAHDQPLSTITNAGTAAVWNVPATGDALATNVVIGTDTRLTDARTPTSHSHNWLVPAGGTNGQALVKGSPTDGDVTWGTVSGAASPTTTRGDMIVRGASADGRLAIGPRGTTLQSDGTDPVWRGPHNTAYFFEDWLSDAATGQTGWTAGAGGGTATIREGTADRPGLASLETSTSATSAPYLRKTAGPPIKLGGGLLLVRFAVQTVTALSDGTDTYTLRIGLGSSATAEPADGVYFTYSHGVNSGKWYCVNRRSSSDSGLDSGVSVANATWYDLAIVVNADATRVDFYIDSVLVSSETIAANITSAAIGPFVHLIKSAGTTDRRIRADYYEFYKELTNLRN